MRLYSLPIEYRPGGEVRSRDGGSELELQLDRPAAWTLIQLFDKSVKLLALPVKPQEPDPVVRKVSHTPSTRTLNLCDNMIN